MFIAKEKKSTMNYPMEELLPRQLFREIFIKLVLKYDNL